LKCLYRITCLFIIFTCCAALRYSPSLAEEAVIVKLSFAGDCTLGGNESWMNYSTGTFMSVMAAQDNTYPFLLTQELFGKDDYTLVNLEGVLSDSSKGINHDRKWNFRGYTKYADILTLGGIEAVTLGNNHSKDYSNYGLTQTKNTLTAAGIDYCDTKEICYYEKGDVKIAFLGFWETAFHSNKKWIKETIPKLKSQESCDAVVVLYHGGNEYSQNHSQTQTDDLHYAIDCGADLCIGHHPHVIQGVEVYKNRTILYSLGDFCFGGNRKPRTIEYPTFIAGFELAFTSAGYQYQQLTIHPFHISGTAPRNNFQPCPALGADASEVLGLIQADTSFPLNPHREGAGAVQDRIYASK
jgi:poly-gamma-glutamate capsule biosynthesis protein CapA/YwtB (metallophosphatase superfamily)